MNTQTRNRHKLYIERVLEIMSDGIERSSAECHEFIDCPRPKDVPDVLGRLKMEFVENGAPHRLKKRMEGRQAFWTLEKKELPKMQSHHGRPK